MMQLKHGDAVRCETKEQWANIIKEASLLNFYLKELGQFEAFPYLIIEENFILTSFTFRGEKIINAKLSYPEFLAKLKGEWQEPEPKKEIKWEVGKFYRTKKNNKALLICDLRDFGLKPNYVLLFWYFRSEKQGDIIVETDIYGSNEIFSENNIIGEWEEKLEKEKQKYSIEIIQMENIGSKFHSFEHFLSGIPTGKYKLVRCEDE